MLNFIDSQRGGKKLVHGGFVYTQQHKDDNFWVCDLYKKKTDKCYARVVTRNDSTEVEVKKVHDDPEKCCKHAQWILQKNQKRMENRNSQVIGELRQKLKKFQSNPLISTIRELAWFKDFDQFEVGLVELLKLLPLIQVKELLWKYYGIEYIQFADEAIYFENYIKNLPSHARDPAHLENLFQNYQRLNPAQQQIINIGSQRLFRSDMEELLKNMEINEVKQGLLKRMFRYISPIMLALHPYTHSCKCQIQFLNHEQECTHWLNNYMILLGNIVPVQFTDQKFEHLLVSGKICRMGRFRDAHAFRDYYFKTQINVSGDVLNSDYMCKCKHIYARNGVHWLCNWLLKNGLLTELDFENYAPKGLRCSANQIINPIDLLDFFQKSSKFAKYEDWNELGDGHLYFSVCIRAKIDRESAVICRTKDRIISGSSMYAGMDLIQHYRYKGNLEAANKVLQKVQ